MIPCCGHLASSPSPTSNIPFPNNTHMQHKHTLINYYIAVFAINCFLPTPPPPTHTHTLVYHCLDLLTESLTQDLSDASRRMCSALSQNLVQLEAACGNLGKVQTILTKLLTAFPSSDGFWLLRAKLSEQESVQGCIDILSEAVTHCPRSPDIYCCAASVLQATGRNNEAIDWLKSCVVQFYKIPEGMEVCLADCFILYRYMFNSHSYHFNLLLSIFCFFVFVFCFYCFLFFLLLENFWDNWFLINTTSLHFLNLLMSKSLDWIWFHCGNAICMVMLPF